MEQRTHPVEMIQTLGRYLFLLLIPLLRGLWYALLSPGSFSDWLSGAWVDAAAVLLMLTASVLRWRSRRFSLSPRGFSLREGVLVRQERIVPASVVSTFSFRQSLFLRLVRAVRVSVFTEGKPFYRADLAFILPLVRAQELFGEGASPPPRAQRQSGTGEVAWFSLFASNALTGAVLLLTLLRSAERMAGTHLQAQVLEGLKGAAALLTFLPRAFTVAALIVLLGWAAAFFSRMAEYRGFCAQRRGKSLLLAHGWTTKQHHLLSVVAIGCLDCRQSLLSLPARLVTVFVRCAGYGKGGRRRAVVLPAVSRQELGTVISRLLPELSPLPVQLRPDGPLWGYAAGPFLILALVCSVWLRITKLFPGAALSIALVGGVFAAAAASRLSIAVIGRRRAGMGADALRVTLRYPRGFLLHTVTIPRNKIVKLAFRQNFFQRRTGRCDAVVWVRGLGAEHHRVKNLPLEAAMALLRR